MSWFTRKSTPTPPSEPAKAQPDRDEIVQTIQKEFERKLSAMAITLEEMSAENTTIHKTLKEREETEKSMRTKVGALESDLEVEREMTREYQRRLEAMTRVLEEVVLQNANAPTQQPVAAKQFSAPFENEAFVSQEQISQAKKARETTPATSPRSTHNGDEPDANSGGAANDAATPPEAETPVKPKTPAASRKKTGAEDIPDDQPVPMPTISMAVPSNLDDIILDESESGNILQTAKRFKAENTELKKEVFKLQQKTQAFASALGKYETKLSRADKAFRENLFKETRRRKDAEYVSSVLKEVAAGNKKRVTQLQFLLDEKGDSSDSDEESEEKAKTPSPRSEPEASSAAFSASPTTDSESTKSSKKTNSSDKSKKSSSGSKDSAESDPPKSDKDSSDRPTVKRAKRREKRNDEDD